VLRHAAYDAVVLGLGAMGSAALHHVVKRGGRALGLERYGPAHASGASHGRSRVIRQAYYESPAYVPLLRRAYELWAGLQAETPQPIWRRTGGVSVGRGDCAVVRGALASAREHGVPCEFWDANDLRRRFPAFAPQPDEVGVFEPTMATLFPVPASWRNFRQPCVTGPKRVSARPSRVGRLPPAARANSPWRTARASGPAG
jgi:sarcosine oxidase